MRLPPFAIALATALLVAQAQPQSVARINVTPAAPSVLATQTLQLRAEAVDSAGKPVPGATIRFQGGSIVEGGVDQQGLVSGGAPGVLDVTVTALVGGQSACRATREDQRAAGPAARIVLEPRPTRLVVGQEIKLRPSVYSKANEPRSKDVVTWSSSAPRVASVNRDGTIAGVKAGRATISATSGDAKETLAKGADPGTVDVIDLTALEKVASIDVAQQAGGIDFWRSEAAAR